MARNSKARGYSSLRRRKGTRMPYDRVLIVCEGSKTECNYFDDIRRKLRLPNTRIFVIPSELGTDPRSVVNSAEQAFARNLRSFERVFPVFDRDDHPDYANAIFMATARNGRLRNDENKPVTFEPIVSAPCFEFWLLLHFEDIKHFLHRDVVLERLRGHILDYTKGMLGVFGMTESLVSIATQRADKLKETSDRTTGTDPYTDVHDLVRVLLKLTTSDHTSSQ
jgi:RloB-like protein